MMHLTAVLIGNNIVNISTASIASNYVLLFSVQTALAFLQ